eukprot:5904126-Lingulodinium_polyedra.AAC.1
MAPGHSSSRPPPVSGPPERGAAPQTLRLAGSQCRNQEWPTTNRERPPRLRSAAARRGGKRS